jgi:sulfite reductase (NADPH) flavoprotein alpha-component
MSAEPIQPLVPLNADKASLLARLVDGLDAQTLSWLSGYAAGLAKHDRVAEREPAPLVALDLAPQLTIVYGSQTGNAKRAAENLAREVETAGLRLRVLRADEYPVRELKSERFLYVVISTQGDGDPPDDSRGFVEFLTSRRAPKLDELRFGVLALGDSSYAKFCAVGMQIDARLAELGGKRLLPRGDADIDIDTIATPWRNAALAAAREVLQATLTPRATVTPLRAPRTIAWHRERPFAAEVLANQRISARGSAKDIRHIELSLRDSGLTYEPGDSLGVWASNPDDVVASILEIARLDGQTPVTHDEQTLPLRDWLIDKREITRLARPFVLAHAQRAKRGDLDALVATPSALQALLGSHQLVDLLHEYPAAWSPADIVAALRPLTPRLYSIASSPKIADDEAHLTVARVAYDFLARAHVGAASNFLSTRADEQRVPVFVEANERFRLPHDPSRDVIMIGPGTGVVPFRAFLQEREAIGARGRNWLFFGNPHFRTDFLYQIEWQAALKRGTLHRIDLAFSRDQGEKIYVQHNLRRNARALYEWIDAGAYVYVCGDAAHMAKDVHAALRDIVIEQGGKSAEDADAFLAQLANERRYCRDVY